MHYQRQQQQEETWTKLSASLSHSAAADCSPYEGTSTALGIHKPNQHQHRMMYNWGQKSRACGTKRGRALYTATICHTRSMTTYRP